jgi:hypothetical protein
MKAFPTFTPVGTDGVDAGFLFTHTGTATVITFVYVLTAVFPFPASFTDTSTHWVASVRSLFTSTCFQTTVPIKSIAAS